MASGARKRNYCRFPVGKYMTMQKEKRDDILKEVGNIQVEEKNYLNIQEKKLNDKKKELCLKRERLRRLDIKVSCVHIQLYYKK